MMLILWLIVGIAMIVFLLIFAKSAAKEAERIIRETDFRIDGIDFLCESLGVENEEAMKLERKAARCKARAEEVKSFQSPVWRTYSEMTQKKMRKNGL